MKELKKKISLILMPLIRLTLVVIIGYSFVHWLLFIEINLLLREDVYLILLPVVIAATVLYFFLRPKLKLFQFKSEKTVGFYCVVFTVAVIVPTIFAQKYLSKALGKRTDVEEVYQIEDAPFSKYYTVNRYHIDTKKVGWYTKTIISGKTSTELFFDAYVVFPIVKQFTEKPSETHVYWLGMKYQKYGMNPKDSRQKKLMIQRFMREIQYDFNLTDFRSFTFLERLDHSPDRKNYVAALRNIGHPKTDKALILQPHFEPFQQRTTHLLLWFFISLGVGFFVCFVFVYYAKLKRGK
ncbi:hypothetical protein HX004_12850 [Myroides sp. 1354]|uniref:hypothetical protein n=1 Tax=unclassified Myroides TaxID=2642485 RepID=UPI002575ACFE|nr:MULTISPECIES: hypothetical protein [unclassified Myroides]MDM1045658.1 hypothetical protein [Myroides sp. R163-1]MDM1056660.1 hypothetical protein [Myroides sp. 1354]MDM1069788.1 hypothetical protein [Myroides sp. 1372]